VSLALTVQRIAAQQGGKYAVPITITRAVAGSGAFDPATGVIATPGTPLTTKAHAVVSAATGKFLSSFENRFKDGTLIDNDLRTLTVFAYRLGFAPAAGDLVTGLEASTWKVLGMTPESMSGVVINYTLMVQR